MKKQNIFLLFSVFLFFFLSLGTPIFSQQKPDESLQKRVKELMQTKVDGKSPEPKKMIQKAETTEVTNLFEPLPLHNFGCTQIIIMKNALKERIGALFLFCGRKREMDLAAKVKSLETREVKP